MRALVLCALALALAVDATVVRVHPATKPAKLQPARLSAELTEALWHQPAGGAAMGDDAVIAGPFHVYYDLQRTSVDEATYAECERFGGDVAARHACRAAKAGPTASEAAAVRTWLAPLGVAASMGAAGCHFAWNAVHCRDVRAGAVRRVFSAPAAPFRTYQRRVGGGASVVAADRYQFTEAALAIPASVAGVVSHVSGLQPFNHVQLAGKHTGVTAPQQQAKSRGKGEDGSASTTSGSSSGSSGPWPQVSPTQLNSFVIPDGDASPIVLHSDGHVVIFALRCAGGELSDNAKYVNASNGVAWENYCPTGKGPTSAPVVALRPRSFAAAPSSAAAVLTAEATVQHCESADVLNSASVSSQNVVVCAVELPAPAAGAIAAFEQLETTVTVAFASGPVVGQAAAFYNGTVYVPGQVNPWTGETIAAAPATPTLTVPSASFVLPATMYEQYAIPREASAAGMVQGVVEFSDVGQPRNGLNISDVPAFLKLINSTASAADLFVIGADSIVSQFETTLDIELIMSMAPGAITYVYCISYGSGATYAGYSDALIGFAATGANVTAGGHAPSAVWSISYGGPEWTSEPSTYEHANTLLGHLSDAGVTVLASSGDQGAYFYEVEMFFGVVVQQFMNFGPSFPAASPHVVAVGASAYRARTQAAAGPSAATYVERVCSVADNNIITSGGGISAFWPTPSYQAPFNSNAKLGVPDVATVGAWIMVVVNGQVQPLFGTSASSPIFGGMVTLLNAQRARTATNATLRAPLRQVPSLLYSTMRAARAAGASTATPFTDVTEGDNCAGEPVQPGWSNNYPVYSRSNCYAAEAGWDAVSGLGTPLFRNLLPAALQWDPRV